MAEQSKNVYQRLLAVQSELIAPRQAGGRFGKARSAEQIVEAAKPLNKKYGLALVTTEEIQLRGDRFYMVCMATVTNVDKPDEQITATAEAREGVEERGLDPSQVTGKASSYAKKYALQHLYAIDDTKDADFAHDPKPKTDQEHVEEVFDAAGAPEPAKKFTRSSGAKPMAPAQSARIYSLGDQLSMDKTKLTARVDQLKTFAEAEEAIKALEAQLAEGK